METENIVPGRINFLGAFQNPRTLGDEFPGFYFVKTWFNLNQSKIHLAGFIKKRGLESSSTKKVKIYCVSSRNSKIGLYF
jgi:hypothetical protein